MIMTDRRRPAVTGELLVRVLLVWLVVAAISVVAKLHQIDALILPDADDTLRLVQVRDLIAGQGWFDMHQYRIDPPHGELMHWSRLADLPLYLIDLGLRPLLGPVMAERATLVIVPLLTMGAVMLLAARLAWRMFDAERATYTALLIALMAPVMAQVGPLRIDHHGWQIVAALAAANGLMARSARRGGWLIGLALALGLTVSLEMLPLAALFGAMLALRWLRDPSERWWLVHFLTALATIGAAALLATRGFADLANHCDTFSPAYIAGVGMAAAASWLLATSRPLPRVPLALALGFVGLSAGATMLALAPQCSAGPFAALDPLVRWFWYDHVYEGMPVWHLSIAVQASMIVPPLLGLIAALRLWARSSQWLRRFWGDYALLLAGSIALSIAVARSSSFACALAAVPLGWQVREWYRAVQRMRRPMRRVAATAGIAAAVMPSLPLLALTALSPARANAEARPDTLAQQVCDIPAAARALNRLPQATLFAPFDLGPVLLMDTHHRVVATAHHRAPQALHDVIAAFLGSPDEAHRLIAAHGARYVVACQGLIETNSYRQNAPRGFMAQLIDGQVPGWLQPIPLPPGTGLLVWKVQPDADQAGLNSSASPFMQ